MREKDTIRFIVPARLKRAIQREILDPLSLEIFENKFHEGQRIRVDARNGSLEFVPA